MPRAPKPPSITVGSDTYTFIRLGVVQPPGEAVEEITRPGIDGVAFRKMGIRCAPFEMQSFEGCADRANAARQILLYSNLRGKLCDLVDDMGQSYPAVMVTNVEVVRQRGLVAAVSMQAGGPQMPTTLLVVRWSLQSTLATTVAGRAITG